MLLLVSAATGRAQAKDGTDLVPVSMSAGETYVINDIKPGTKPSFNIAQNPNAFVSYDSPAGKLTILAAEAGHWIVTVTNTSDHVVSYDFNSLAAAKPGAPLTPGTAPPPVNEPGLESRPGAGASTSTPAAMPELATISSSPSSSSPAAPYSADVAAKTSSSFDASSTVPPQPGKGVQAYEPSQTVGPLESHAGQYRNNPSVLDSAPGYLSETVSGGKHYLPADTISLMVDTSEVIDFQRRITRISVADSKIADVQVIDPFQLNLIAHQPGFTTLAIWDADGRYEERPVRIDPHGKQQVMLDTMVAELDRSAIENQGTNLSAALSHAGVSLVGLPGAVATPFSPSSSVTSPSGVVSSVGNTLEPGGFLTGLLLSQGMTYGLATGNKDYQLQGFFQYLENHQLAKILAEPHLLANSGEEAKFLSGGEIPIVIAQALNTSIVFKQFGTAVQFVPTVVGRNDIELLVKPEVSEPDYAEGVSMFGFTIPAFVTRRAETMVQLKDNQTLIIAGLILHEKKTQVQKVPYLGDVPYLGGLFRNTSYSNTETDLVMSVTPQIVRPLPDGASVYNPTSVPELTPEQTETRRLAQPDASRPRF